MAPRYRVLITRAAHQGFGLAERLTGLGAEPVLIPAIETVPPASFDALDAALSDLITYDWLLFTSVNAVNAFAERTRSNAPATSSSPRVNIPRIAAIGPSTAQALEAIGLRADLIPPRAVAESLADTLLSDLQSPRDHITRVLLVRAEEAREALPETLRAAGAEVTIAPAYKTVIPSGSVELLRECFAEVSRQPDAITFTSSSTVHNLLALCEAAGVTLPDSALRVSIGPITSETLRQLGIPPHAEAPDATVASLAETVMQALRQTRQPEMRR